MKMRLLVTLLITAATIMNLSAGTIIFKDGSVLSDIEIVSIADGKVTVEKNDARKTYSVKVIKAYYRSNIKTGGNATPDKYAPYKVVIYNTKAPKKGRDSNRKTTSFDIEYAISKKGAANDRIKKPYFFLFVLTTGKKDEAMRKVYSYYSPSEAKIRSKNYDGAEIMAKVLEFGRPEMSLRNIRLKSKLTGRKISFSLKGISHRKVLAWHLEVWGNTEKIYEKSEVQYPEYGIGKRWWERVK